MPISYSIDSSQQLVSAFASGVLNVKMLSSFLTDVRKDPEFNPDYRLLLDLSTVAEFDLTPADLQRVSDMPAFSARSRTAIVAISPLAYGLAREYEGSRGADRGELRVFRWRGDALSWVAE